MPYPLTPNPASSYSPAYGGIPSVPSPISTAQEAVTGNIGNLGGLYQLAGGVNRFNQSQAPLGLQANLPGYQSTLAQLARNAGQQAQGLVPQDVQNQIAQMAAERGTATGMGANAPNTNAAMLRALGLTSIGQQALGQENFGKLVGLTPQAPIFDPSKFFVTPDQEQQAQAAADLYKSAPVPADAAQMALHNAALGMQAGQGGAPRITGGVSQPFQATNWGTPAPTSASSLGTGLTYGGITYPAGSSPSTATTNWNSWYSGVPKSPVTGPGNFYAGPANPMFADEYFGGTGSTGGPMFADEYFGEDTGAPAVSTRDPFMGLGSFAAGGTGVAPGATAPGVGDLLGSLTPEDLAGFM